MHFIIKPKGMIPSHKHKNTETLVILKGKGKVCVNNQIGKYKVVISYS